ncbi:unnamed protein product [Microthlaspi erraticum]|uniref:RNase H type-1 domain-containing protein n=1 Tax=Microthlaspi erraticum TaxID=1685480 RepID=A0A6D2IYP3_9BRAS|nr:unnamed protein product [Microthlaspi erraticum]
MQHFLWKAIAGALSTAERLCSRGINIDPICQRCGLEDETINHLLLQCQHAQTTWRCADYTVFNVPQDALEDNIRKILHIYAESEASDEVRILPFWITWMLWKSRNEMLFQQKMNHPNEDAVKWLNAVSEWVLANPVNHHSSVSHRAASTLWEPPPMGFIKCNFDSSFSQNSPIMKVGWILRDSRGSYMEAGWATLPQVETPLQAEASGFLYVVQRMWYKGLRQVWFEGDNLELTNIINTVRQSVELGNLLCDIRHWITKLPQCSLGHVNREKNQAADVLCKHYLSNSVNLCKLYETPPSWLVNYLYYPFTF